VLWARAGACASPQHPAPGSGSDSTAAPYRRWWQREGCAAFEREQQAWSRLVADVRPARGLDPDWIELARSPLETPLRGP